MKNTRIHRVSIYLFRHQSFGNSIQFMEFVTLFMWLRYIQDIGKLPLSVHQSVLIVSVSVSFPTSLSLSLACYQCQRLIVDVVQKFYLYIFGLFSFSMTAHFLQIYERQTHDTENSKHQHANTHTHTHGRIQARTDLKGSQSIYFQIIHVQFNNIHGSGILDELHESISLVSYIFSLLLNVCSDFVNWRQATNFIYCYKFAQFDHCFIDISHFPWRISR